MSEVIRLEAAVMVMTRTPSAEALCVEQTLFLTFNLGLKFAVV